jgi:YD repeat-containing protein
MIDRKTITKTDALGNIVYQEWEDGTWGKWERDKNGNETRYDQSDGYWAEWEYDERGLCIRYENSDGWWRVYEYDKAGRRINTVEGRRTQLEDYLKVFSVVIGIAVFALIFFKLFTL